MSAGLQPNATRDAALTDREAHYYTLRDEDMLRGMKMTSFFAAANAPKRRSNPPPALLHEPSVADDNGLAGERIRIESSEEERGFRHILHRGEFTVHGVFQHDVLDHVLLGNAEFLGLLCDLLVHQRGEHEHG